MQLKSNIDWNEMFPHFKKELRETLLLEAVTLLSGRSVTNGHAKAAKIVKKAALVKATTQPKHVPRKGYTRYWRQHGSGGTLSRKGRSYSINRDHHQNFRPGASKVGKVWNVLLRNGSPTFTYEAFMDLAENAGLDGHATLSQLWSKGCFEVVPDSPKQDKK